MKRPLGVYVHIPFCRSKCPYCAFNSVTDGFSEDEWTSLLMEDFLLKCRAHGLGGGSVDLRSIYLGGGTPSVFLPRAVGEIISLVKATLGAGGAGGEGGKGGEGARGGGADPEVTLEANPADAHPARLEGYLLAGVNRISLGVQSLDQEELQRLGRRHGPVEAVSAMRHAREAGLRNIGVDLMYGIPGQDLSSWEKTLAGVLEEGPSHVSLYNLSIEENTPFYTLYPPEDPGVRSERTLKREEEEAAMFEMAMAVLGSAGYVHYEISNFALPGLESVHNSGYWLGREYLGIGPGAHSFFSSGRWGMREWNERELSLYRERLASGSAVSGGEALTREEAMVEAVFLGLRMPGAGLDLETFRQDFGEEAFRRFYMRCAEYGNMGLISVDNGRVTLRSHALFTSNEVCARLLA